MQAKKKNLIRRFFIVISNFRFIFPKVTFSNKSYLSLLKNLYSIYHKFPMIKKCITTKKIKILTIIGFKSVLNFFLKRFL